MKDLLPTGFPPMLFQIFNLNVVRLLRLCWWGVRSFYFGVGGLILLGGHVILKLKLHNTSIKSIFGITNLIYFRDIWKMHLLSSDKISFSMAIWCKCLEHCCFSSKHFLKQVASHVSAATLQLKFPGMKFFLIHSWHWSIFCKVFKFFA